MFRNLIFDWSGTLCDDLSLTIEATNYVLSQYGRQALSRESFRAEFQLPYPEYYAHKVPEATMPELEAHYRHAFDNSQTGVTELPHARDFMDFCRTRGYRCFILTSMHPKAFAEQAAQLGFTHYFEAIHSGIRNKEQHIGKLMKQHGLKPEETAFIGDMQHDVNTAHCAGITSIAVLTGYNNAEHLAASTPMLTVPDLSALRSLLERMPERAQDSILLKSLQIDCHIGVPDEERAQAQRLLADIEICPRLNFCAMGEDITQSICYDTLAQRLVALAQEEPTKLLETLADKMARCCVQEFGAASATVELHKFLLQLSSTAVRCTRQG